MDETNEREFALGAGQPGIPFEAMADLRLQSLETTAYNNYKTSLFCDLEVSVIVVLCTI